MRTSVLSITDLELGQPHIVHRPCAAQSTKPGECGHATPLTIDLDVVRVRPTPKRHVAFKGEISRLILTLLREAGEPLPTRELIRRNMEARGLNVADKGLYELMRERIGASLRGMRQRGRLVSSGGKGASVRWSLT